MKFPAHFFALLLLFLGQALRLRADNDNFAEATDLSAFSSPYYTYIGGAGTAEVGEPTHAGSPAARSYWFRWTPVTSGPCGIREYLLGNTARIAVYTGNTLTTLNVVTQGTQRVFFQATAGVTYRIAIDSNGADFIQLKTYPAGSADTIEGALPILGSLPRRVQGNNVLATTTAGDPTWYPSVPPQATVWWVWTAPADGAIRFDGRRSDFENRLTAYERAPGGSPVQVSAGFGAVGMVVKAGHDYLFCVDGTNDRGEIDVWLESIPTTDPPNDNIENATDLGSPLIACDGGWIFFATAQAIPQESVTPWSHDYTLWWKWTCPQSGAYRFSQHGSDGSSMINVYTGTPPPGGSLTNQGGLEIPDGVRISATAGTTYYIQIKNSWRTSVRAELNIHPASTEPRYFTYFAERGFFRLMGSQRHPDADPDGDGFSNEIEFACYSDPQVYNPNDPNLPRLTMGPSSKTFSWVEDGSYLNPGSGPLLSLKGQTSLDLTSPWLEPTPTPSSGGRKTITLPNSTRAFARLKLTNPNWTPGP